MSKLEQKQTAFSLASATVAQPISALDAATAAKAGELKLTDQEYLAFRNDAVQYRNGLLPALKADQQAAAKPVAAPTPAPKPAQK